MKKIIIVLFAMFICVAGLYADPLNVYPALQGYGDEAINGNAWYYSLGIVNDELVDIYNVDLVCEISNTFLYTSVLNDGDPTPVVTPSVDTTFYSWHFDSVPPQLVTYVSLSGTVNACEGIMVSITSKAYVAGIETGSENVYELDVLTCTPTETYTSTETSTPTPTNTPSFSIHGTVDKPVFTFGENLTFSYDFTVTGTANNVTLFIDTDSFGLHSFISGVPTPTTSGIYDQEYDYYYPLLSNETKSITITLKATDIGAYGCSGYFTKFNSLGGYTSDIFPNPTYANNVIYSNVATCTYTFTPTITATITPTITQTATKTVTQTVTITITPTITPTPIATLTIEKVFYPNPYTTYFSGTYKASQIILHGFNYNDFYPYSITTTSGYYRESHDYWSITMTSVNASATPVISDTFHYYWKRRQQ